MLGKGDHVDEREFGTMTVEQALTDAPYPAVMPVPQEALMVQSAIGGTDAPRMSALRTVKIVRRQPIVSTSSTHEHDSDSRSPINIPAITLAIVRTVHLSTGRQLWVRFCSHAVLHSPCNYLDC